MVFDLIATMVHAHQALHRAPGNIDLLAAKLPPDLLRPVHGKVLVSSRSATSCRSPRPPTTSIEPRFEIPSFGLNGRSGTRSSRERFAASVPAEVRERAIRLVIEQRVEHGSEYFPCLPMAPSSQASEPPGNPGRFKAVEAGSRVGGRWAGRHVLIAPHSPSPESVTGQRLGVA